MRWILSIAVAVPALTILAIFTGMTSAVAPLALSTSIIAVAVLIPLLARREQPAEQPSTAPREIADLRARIDLLAAEREVSLVLNQDVDFKVILSKVLEITAGLIGGHGNEEIAIFLKDDQSGRLVPRAARIGGETLFDDLLTGRVSVDETTVAPLENGRQILTAGNERVDIALPLTADRDLIGVMRIRVPLEGESADRHHAIDRMSAIFDEFSRFISLAVKTPDLYTRAVEDGLTKLSTKRHFLTQLAFAFDAARRYADPLSLIMIDIDHFKKINDTHGHQTGDIALKGVAEVIRKNLRRAGDAAYSGYRYGGEELCILLPKTPADKALIVAERLRKGVEGKSFRSDRGVEFSLTISAGLAEVAPSMKEGAELTATADQALYRAKQEGRNRICVAPTIANPSPTDYNDRHGIQPRQRDATERRSAAGDR
ncbi:MAG: hypothetical protein A2Z34_07440 [Planctomycetes bacterium RBG_16_59_8]|nr:MAG: hypothetical protein A2Z34_07440 [Planctomycetes bacterium RBG_16_59_8]